MRERRVTELIAAATEIHDQAGCGCDRRYLASCPRMAAAILTAGRHRETAAPAEPGTTTEEAA